MIELPREKIKAVKAGPKKLLIVGRPKIGKTTLLAGLEGNLNIDLENSSDDVDMMKINVSNLEDLIELGKKIKATNEKEGKKIYKSISIDTLTKFEEIAWQLALRNYKATLVGKNFQGDSNALKQLPKGAGYPLKVAA